MPCARRLVLLITGPAIRRLLPVLALLACLLAPLMARAVPVSLADPAGDEPLGQYLQFMKEDGRRLGLAEARAALAAGRFQPLGEAVASFGIGAPPVWLYLAVDNPAATASRRRLLIENPWLDQVEVFFLSPGQAASSVVLGDRLPHAERPAGQRFLGVDHAFAPGGSEVLLRVASPDPEVIPLRLQAPAAAVDRELAQGYGYGFVYGYLAALLGYNAVLFLALRDRRYLCYGAFLAAFLALNVAYTGHGFAWLWPRQVLLQQWIIPVLMVVFSSAGLTFARCFLNTRSSLPRADRVLRGAMLLAWLGLGLAMLVGDNQFPALLVAFAFTMFFSGAMLAVGLLAFRARIPASPYFLLASIASMVGTALTSLSVWGGIPFTGWGFHAAEIGMLVDATLLAAALGSQFRGIQLEKAVAELSRIELSKRNARLNDSLREVERLAATDRLTGLWNRRHLEGVAAAEMERASRYQHPTSLLLFDIDHFKRVNDIYGHRIGDQVLEALARLVSDRLRESDVATRWGGEEFLVLMPNTALADAVNAAEKLRQTVAANAFGNLPVVTISVGVAEWAGPDEILDGWIGRADQALYLAKGAGRNRVMPASRPGEAPGSQWQKPLLQLSWSADYACGHADIDREHRGLFQSANSVLAVYLRPDGGEAATSRSDEVLSQVDALLANLRRHFATEEAILHGRGWGQLAGHRAEHQRLLERAEVLRQAFRARAVDTTAIDTVSADTAAASLLDFLIREVVIGHVLGADRDYVALVQGEWRDDSAEPAAGLA